MTGMMGLRTGRLWLLGALGLSACVPSAGSRQPGPVLTMPMTIRAPSDSLVCALMTDANFSAAEAGAARGRIALLRQRRGDAGCEVDGAADHAGTTQWLVRASPPTASLPNHDGPLLTAAESQCSAGGVCAVAGLP